MQTGIGRLHLLETLYKSTAISLYYIASFPAGSPAGVQERAEASLHKRPPASLQLRPKTEVPQRPHQEVRQRPQTGNQDDREDINVGKSGGLSNSWHSENMFCSQVAREDCQTVPVQKCDSVKDEQCRNVPRQVLRGRN